MPTIRDLQRQQENLMLSRIRMTERSNDAVLPEGFCIEVASRCETEAERVRKAKAYYEAELTKCEQELKTARSETPYDVQELREVRGDMIDEKTLRVTSRQVVRTTAATVQYKQEVIRPIMERQRRLRAMIYACETELGELKHLHKSAFLGEVGLIHFLSNKWKARLEIGPSVLGTLPQKLQVVDSNVIKTDASGSPLPPEVMDPSTGEPGLNLAGGKAPERR